MKRLLSFIVLISCAGLILAQDIIVLKSGERIENAKVQSVTDKNISYVLNGNTISIPHNSAEAILYADGRYEEISTTFVGDSAAIAAVEQLGYNAEELQALKNSGEDRKMLLWQDKFYPKECRKEGKKIYDKVFKEFYTPAFKEAKASGLNAFEAIQQATNEAFIKALKASNDVVRECNGGMLNQTMYPNNSEDEMHVRIADNYDEPAVNESMQNTSDPIYEQKVDPVIVYNEPLYEEPEPVREQPTETVVEVVEEEKEKVPAEQPVVAANESETIFTVDKKYLSFSASGGSQQVHVNANSPWAIYSSPEWTEVRRLGGRLTIICTENTQRLEREEDVVLRIKSGQVIRIVVSQDKIR